MKRYSRLGSMLFALILFADVAAGQSIKFTDNVAGDYDYGQQVSIPTGFGAGEFTFELWIKPDNSYPIGSTTGMTNDQFRWSSDDNQPYSSFSWWFPGNFLIDGHNNSDFKDGTFSLQFYGGGRLRWLFGDGTSAGQSDIYSVGVYPASGTPSLLDGQWHQVTLVRRFTGASSSQLEMWIDGSLIDTETTPARTNMRNYWNSWTGFPSGQEGWFYGAEKQAAIGSIWYEDFKGLLDEVRFWNRAKSASEIASDYNKSVSGTENGLVGVYRFNSLSGANACNALNGSDCISLIDMKTGFHDPENAPLDGATPTPTPTPTPPPSDLDFTQNGGTSFSWIGGPLPGFGGSTTLNASGLCMSVPAGGDNFVLWLSPELWLELTANTIYRSRVTASTDQTAADAIPLFFFLYDNFVSTGQGNAFGGYAWLLDVDGGAQGIGRPQGRTIFDFYWAPNAVNTTQWNNNAFTTAADAVNDVRLQFNIIDANAGLATQLDSGTICVSRLQLSTFTRSSIALDSTVYNPPFDTSTHFAEANNEVGIGGTATIDNTTNEVRYQLTTSGTAKKTLGPFDPSAGGDFNLQLYPVVWDQDRLYRVRSRIRGESSAANPVDAIFLAFDTTNVELGTSQYTTRGAAPLDLAASPKLTAAPYEVYFYSQNATESTTPNADRMRPFAIFFNTDQLAGSGTGANAFIVETLVVDRLVTP